MTSSVPDAPEKKLPKWETKSGTPRRASLSWGERWYPAQRRRRRGTPSGLGLSPAGRTGVRAGLGRLTLQSLRTNIMPWPGYIGPEQK